MIGAAMAQRFRKIMKFEDVPRSANVESGPKNMSYPDFR